MTGIITNLCNVLVEYVYDSHGKKIWETADFVAKYKNTVTNCACGTFSFIGSRTTRIRSSLQQWSIVRTSFLFHNCLLAGGNLTRTESITYKTYTAIFRLNGEMTDSPSAAARGAKGEIDKGLASKALPLLSWPLNRADNPRGGVVCL
ncbi:hypothetical protein CEXT_101 [Caerostris extrusa]|uniref:Uncharacterized protein n=1 Tax=Caerostris extrusa TaxID=172846 RepID=A0AAV4WPV0_CAEEX|nr:hypothetical protein CEXT_101 [Caerostris extrusa]